ncbi:unnamed protein product [Oppiella nova]|uniref:Uncharacterized protein n=1 Tax=Oppiella nova TaxID=334625 RepID=A0A7R9QY74_9ACAR|nr:unnamed protein product [Oppiella nova]CAG2178691.1 unnamed protein product [Oppiella nova]
MNTPLKRCPLTEPGRLRLSWARSLTHHVLGAPLPRTWEITFELGKEFDAPRFGGTTAKSLVVADGNRLIQTVKGEKELKIVREFNGNELRATSTTGSVTAVTTYAKQ